MKIALVIFVIITVLIINPLFAFVAPATTTLIAAPLSITSQFHSQDSLGQYAYGYSGGPSIKAESKSIDGITRGSYSYIDPDGKLQTVEYTADALNGFRAAATNLPHAPIDDKLAPEPVQETPEVAKARAEHLAAYKEAEIRAAKYPEEPSEIQNDAMLTNNNGNGNGNGNGNINGHNGGNGNDGNGNNDKKSAITTATAVNAITSGLQSVDIATVRTLPASTSIALPAPITTFKAIEIPPSSYSYRIENTPIHGYSVVTPTVYSTPLTSTGYSTLTTSPVLTGVRPLTVSTRILADRTIDLTTRNLNGNGRF